MAISYALAFLISIAYAQTAVVTQPRTGKQVVDAVCASCHASGTNGAPRIGDRNAWSKRSSQGLTSLTSTAIEGIRKMPPHGGNPAVSDFEIQQAITYMVNQSGGRWVEPIDKSAPARPRSGERIVIMQCANCHESGKNGAPRIGDRDAWIPRLKPGFDIVVRSAINGHGGMPSRGGMADLSDAEVRNAIAYMFNPGSAGAK